MVARIDEELIRDRAAAFADEIGSSSSLPGDCWRSKDLEESVGMRLQGFVTLVGSVMSSSAAPTNVYPCEAPSVRIKADPIAPHAASERVWKKISGQMGGSDRFPSRFHGAKTRHLQAFRSALGRTRTCGLLIRSKAFLPSVKSRLVPFGPV